MKAHHDFLVIGSGIAGLTFALKAAEFGSVAIITKDAIDESATRYAQGGIASVMAENDSYDFHVKDTLEAGHGLCREDVVKRVVSDGPARVRELVQLGTQFARAGSLGFDLGREGGHSRRRILHANDMTGWEIERALLEAVRDRSNIEIFDYHMAIDLITLARIDSSVEPGGKDDEALGLYVLDVRENQVKTFLGKVTLLATGGAGKVYLYTSNPDTATGDGIAMAYRVGAKIANMEFFQFHPTCLYHPEAKSFLISEAVRGEGGILRRKDGTSFMERHDARGCLAPRDVVARAIDYEMKLSGEDCVFLDITHIEPYRTRERFPNIYKTCLNFGFDMTREPLPVVPAAHYMCGGVTVDLNGQTNVRRLFASGETCYSGLHGANRLASNSLLEGLVLSHRAVSKAVDLTRTPSRLSSIADSIPFWDNGDAVPSDERVVVSQNWDEIRRLMWNYVGIVRSDKRLLRAQGRIDLLLDEIHEYYWNFHINKDTIELRNIALTARLVIEGSLQRKESRGLHYNIDYPDTDNTNWKRETVLCDSSPSLMTRFPFNATRHD
tara:strand:- start:789 stop:2450 length:1662 start_codon:yes stop_codon:yes gene_type:complete